MEMKEQFTGSPLAKAKDDCGKQEPDETKNAGVYTELIQVVHDQSLSLIMRDAKEDSKKAIGILRNH